jgi:hypothetical protein
VGTCIVAFKSTLAGVLLEVKQIIKATVYNGIVSINMFNPLVLFLTIF